MILLLLLWWCLWVQSCHLTVIQMNARQYIADIPQVGPGGKRGISQQIPISLPSSRKKLGVETGIIEHLHRGRQTSQSHPI
jgi:hypothetical protein